MNQKVWDYVLVPLIAAAVAGIVVVVVIAINHFLFDQFYFWSNAVAFLMSYTTGLWHGWHVKFVTVKRTHE